MKARTWIAGLTLLAGCATTTFAGDRRVVDAPDHFAADRHEVIARHDDGHLIDRDRDLRRVDVRFDRPVVVHVDHDCR